MSRRFFVERPIESDFAQLAGSEAHHLSHVMRAVVGEEITVFDGSGSEFSARITEIGRQTVKLDIVGRQSIDREAACRVTLGVALPKGDRQKWLVEKCVELGVHRLTPLLTERSVSKPTAKSIDRLKRAVIESSKQCGRNRLMEIAEATQFNDWLAAQAPLRWVADPQGSPINTGMPSSEVDGDAALATVGPEGGFSESEIEVAIRAGWRLVSLGPRILRVETAALVLAATFSIRNRHA